MPCTTNTFFLTILGPFEHLAINRPPHRTSLSKGKEITSSWLQTSITMDTSTICTQPNFFTQGYSYHITSIWSIYFQTMSESRNTSNAQYLTLGHRWGGNISCFLTHNFKELVPNINVEILVRVFQHSISVTNDLGYKYLRIDSLYIFWFLPQAGPRKECKWPWYSETESTIYRSLHVERAIQDYSN